MSHTDVNPTLLEQERLLKSAKAQLKRRSSGPEPIAPAAAGERLPLSFAQQRIWFTEQMDDTDGAYHVRRQLCLKGALHRPALVRALERIVSRHDALRTTFVKGQDEHAPEQRITPPEEYRLTLREHDLSQYPDAGERVESLLAEESREPFDLRNGPLMRALLIRVAADVHVLVLTLHHIIGDAWSMSVLVRELSDVYGAFRRGEPDPLPPLSIRYADFAAWQRRWVHRAVLQEQAEYWRGALAGAPELLALPTDRPRPARQQYDGAVVDLELDEHLTARLRALSRRHETTLFMTLLAAWAIVLGRLSGQHDVVIGTPVANRSRPDVQGLVGLFLNSLAVRVDLSGDQTVADVLAAVKVRVLAAQHHQDLPFEHVVEVLQPVRTLAYNPIFQVTLAWHDAAVAFSLPGLEVLDLRSQAPIKAKSDLMLTLRERRDKSISGSMTYRTTLFDRETIESHLEYLRIVLEQMVLDDRRPVNRLALLRGVERARVVEQWNDTHAEYPREQCAHEAFAAQAARTPDAVAVVADGACVSYRELNRRANRLAHHLRARQVGPDTRVAISAEPSIELLIGLLAVLKAGGAYVPLDPTSPRDRLRQMLVDSGSAIVLTTAARRAWCEGTEIPAIALDADAADWAEAPAANPDRGSLAPEHLAYLIYTSGSTGRPKGVMIDHAGLMHYIWWARSRYVDADALRFPLYSAVAFDLTVTTIYVPLISGGAVEIYADDRRTDRDLPILRVFHDDAVDVVKLTPSHLRLLQRQTPQARAPRRIRRLIVGGEDFTTDLARWAHDQSGGTLPIEIENEYGPTETVVGCMIHRFDAGVETTGSVSIGRPIANTRVYVLDEAGQPAPIGAVGELYVGGPGMARGYAGRPGATAERFVADAISGVPGARLYRTGDLARWRANGSMEFLGRGDHQVKVRGYRIELGEIEARLNELDAIHDAAVVAREDTPGETTLVAYYIGAAGGDALDVGRLRDHLAATLPEYMIPAAYVRLDAFPLSPSGKLDRRALPAPDDSGYKRRGYEAPANVTEIALANIWSGLLSVDRVGRHDNFFELGGHSILALKLTQQMRKQGLRVGIQTVFAKPTIAELAAEIDAKVDLASTPQPVSPAPEQAIDEAIAKQVDGGVANIQDVYPLSPLQEGMLFHHVTSKDRDPYLLMFLTEFDRRERLDAYLAALQAVIDRNDILRTAVLWQELSEPVQVVWRKARLEVVEVALDPADGDVAEQLRRRCNPESHRLDIRRAPMIRLYVAHDPRAERWLMLRYQHHLITDHAAAKSINEEIEAHLAGRAHELPPPSSLRDYLSAAAATQSKPSEYEPFFKALLGDITEPTAPFGLMNVLTEGVGIEEHRLLLDEGLSTRLRARARALGVSTASLFHVAWGLVLARVSARVSARRDVVFGTVMAGRSRDQEGVDRAMGLFVNTLPVRLQAEKVGLEAVVRQVHTLLTDLMRYEDVSLASVQRCSGVVPPTPLFTSLLNYRGRTQKRTGPAAAAASLGMKTIGFEERSNYPLTIGIDDHGDQFSYRVKVEPRVGARRTSDLMQRALEVIVETLESARDVPLERLDVLPESERAQVVREWNASGAPYPEDKCAHELFEARVEQCPDAVALVHDAQQVSYRELNRRANRLAHYLREVGVAADGQVAICIERSLDLVIAKMAVLKAGGGYVPLDPAYPLERLRYMLEDSRAVALLASPALAGLFTGIDVPVLRLDAIGPRLIGQPAANVERSGVRPDHSLYLIYTSGSTGQPKGVLNPHRGVVNRLTWMQRKHRLEPGDAVLQNSSSSFDASVFETFWPLAMGARMVLAPHASHKDPTGLVDTIRRQGVSTVYFVCSMLQYFLEIPGAERCTSLKRVMCGGERLTPMLSRHFAAKLPGAKLWNLYGPSESAVSATTCVGSSDVDLPTVPIGHPTANVRVYLLGEDGQPVPSGVIGELHIGGAQLARAYVNRPDMTADRFRPDAFGAKAGERLYRTGDLGRWLPDGRIEFLGRNDDQIKVRGFRIEPAEIETRLKEHEGVHEAVIVAREDTVGDQRLVAFWEGDADLDAAALRGHVGAALPEYMVPSAFVRLDALPRTPSGKLDRGSLPAPDGAACTTRSYEAPVGPKEIATAEVWSDVLRVQRIGRHDHFFELGGHSLLAVRVIERMRRKGLHSDVRTLFMTPVLAELAAQAASDASRFEVPLNPIARLVPTAEAADLRHAEWRL